MKFNSIFRIARLSLGVAWLFAAVVWLPHKAEASLTQVIFDPFTDTKLGEIAFPSATGSSAVGVDFSFDGGFMSFLFTEADITSITWVLDPDSWDIISIGVGAFQGDIVCENNSALPCSNAVLNLGLSTATIASFSCPGGGAHCIVGDSFFDVAFRHAVPKPPSLALFVIALGGLGFMMRRRRVV